MSQALNRVIFQQDDEDTQHGKYLTFPLGGEVFGIEIQYVTEIIGIQAITFVPEVPPYVKGIINLRGKIIPVVDMRLKFDKPEAEYTDRTCIVVVDEKDVSIGLIVDSVADVVDIPDDQVLPPPRFKSGRQNKYIKGIGKVDGEVRMLIDCDMIAGDGERAE